MAKAMVVCGRCSKSFARTIKWINKNARSGLTNYCSRACQGQATRTGVLVTCSQCGKEIWTIPSRLKMSKSGEVFCSKPCANGKHNPSRTGEAHPLYDGGATLYRKRAFEKYGKACTVCGYDIGCVLEVHHRDGNRRNNKVENLDVLCPTHHDEFEHGIRSYQIQGGAEAA